MNLFSAVKAGVTPLQAAERYGIRVSPRGKALCPFHEDHEPSLQIDRSHFYCFGCGAYGDVIDFTARLFRLSAYEAAEKLASDFGLPPGRSPPANLQEHPNRKAQLLRENERLCFFYLNAYSKLLHRFLRDRAPKTPEDEIDDRFAEACQWLCPAENLLDRLLGDREEAAEAVQRMLRENSLKRLQRHLEKLKSEEENFGK